MNKKVKYEYDEKGNIIGEKIEYGSKYKQNIEVIRTYDSNNNLISDICKSRNNTISENRYYTNGDNIRINEVDNMKIYKSSHFENLAVGVNSITLKPTLYVKNKVGNVDIVITDSFDNDPTVTVVDNKFNSTLYSDIDGIVYSESDKYNNCIYDRSNCGDIIIENNYINKYELNKNNTPISLEVNGVDEAYKISDNTKNNIQIISYVKEEE